MTRTRSRKLQIVTFIVGVSIAALFWAGLLINLDRLAQTYDRLTIEQTQSLALAFEEQTERTFQVVDSALFALKREYEASPAGFVLEAGLGHIDLPKKIVRRIAVVDAQGLILRTEAGPPSQVVSVADREYFRSQRQADVGLLVSPPLIGRASGLWGIQLSRRLQAPDGSFAGVIVATIDPSYLAQFFARVSPKPGSSVTLVGLDGLVRAHSPVINGIEGQDVSGGPLFAHLKQASNGFYRAVSIIDGTERFLSYRSIPDLALVITVGTSVAEALAPQRAQRDQTLIAAGVGTLAIGALLWGLVAAIETRRQLSIERDFQAGRLGIANERLGESEERYRSLIENLTEVVFRTDREGRWTFLNRAWAELTGFEVEETLQRPFLASFQTNDGEEGWRQFEALLAGDLTACRFESRYLTKTGEACWIEIFARLVRDAQGAITGTAGTLSDITERRDALDALRDSELRYAEKSRTLAVTLENIEQGIVMIAADGSVPVSNGRAIELLDLPPELMATRPHFQTVLDYQSKAGEFDGLEPEAVARVVKGCLAREVLIYERTRANGRTIEFRSVPLDGGGIVRTYTDVTERRASEKVLREAKEVAEQASRTRTAFLATLSHEIRTPLNGVIGLTDLLLATPLDAMQGDYVRGLAASTEHLLLIVDDVLDFAKLDADRLELEQIPFDLFELVNGTIDILTPRAAAKQLTIAAKLPSGGIHHFYGDAKRTRQILLNIVGNGVKFTDHGEVLVVAEVQPSGGSARIILSVKDTGIGIPPEARDRLFDEFTQFDSSITRRFGGTGLGLAICKRLVEAMAGKITVANDGDGYTTFRVELSLPIANAADLPVLLREAQPIVLERGLRVLLAEDNQTNQMIVQITLEKVGCVVDVALNGRQAVEAMRSRSYDLILMDLMMPEMGGLEAAREIRNLSGLERLVPIIAMSASAGAEDRIACAQAGMDGFIAKPFVPHKMLSQIRDVLADRNIGGLFDAAPYAAGAAPDPAHDGVDHQVVAGLFSAYGAMANTFVDTFLVETGKRLERMDGNIAANKPDQLVLDAHSLKGAALTFGCIRLSALAGAIEADAAAGRDRAWADLLVALRVCFRQTTGSLRQAATTGAMAQ